MAHSSIGIKRHGQAWAGAASRDPASRIDRTAIAPIEIRPE
jgi:hypothetical protein